ncbi:hypothetical protein BGZ65_009587, partial [Modicella reniformis]
CDTGFGAEITQNLYQHGDFTVYATWLTQEAVAKAIQIDVTNQDDVNRLHAQVEAECPQGVYCVLNNAALSVYMFATEDSFQKIMDVNFMGIILISKAMLPSLRTFARSRQCPHGKHLPRARLLTTTSVAGRSNPPGYGGYNVSKHDAESIMDTLRVELSPWEIDVSMLEPFYAKTPIVAGVHHVLDKVWKAAHPQVQKMYIVFLTENRLTMVKNFFARPSTDRAITLTAGHFDDAGLLTGLIQQFFRSIECELAIVVRPLSST